MGLAGRAGAGVLRLLGATWRIARVAPDGPGARIAAQGRCVFAFWHARLLPLAFTHRGRGIGVLISRHHDGELIARVVERLGFTTARGSSTRGGEAGVRDMLRLAERGHPLAITPDGPRGPAEVAKAGVVMIASRSGLPVLPVVSSASRAWRLSSWDGFRIPWPFARVVVAYGEPIHVPARLPDDQVETWRIRIETALHDLTRDAAARAGESP